MTPQTIETLLLLALLLLVVVSFYTAWLWLNLQITRRVINAMPVIQPTNGHTDMPANGCVGLLVILLLILLVIGLLGAGG